jgi:alkyl hydroperoxide reductase subunit F
MYDLIIVGGGPAGLTAAIYALRKRLNVLVITRDLGGKANFRLQLPDVDHHLVINGDEIVNRFVNELEYLEFARVMEKAVQVEPITGGYRARVSGGQVYEAKALVVATGTNAQRLNVPGEKAYTMRGLCYSAISYAPLFIDRDVVVVGDGALALRAAAELAQIAHRVTLVAPTHGELDSPLGRRLQSLESVVVLEGQWVDSVKGDEYAHTLVLTKPNGVTTDLHADAFFVELGLVANSELVKGLVALDEQGRIKVDARNRTSAAGLFAAGDVSDVYAEQVLIAIGEGAKAALSAYEYLLSQPATEAPQEAKSRQSAGF